VEKPLECRFAQIPVSFQIGLCRLGILALELRRILHEVMQLEVSSPLGVEGTPIATMQSLLGYSITFEVAEDQGRNRRIFTDEFSQTK
jgi:hypothetical protein